MPVTDGPAFRNPAHFTATGKPKRYYCNLCFPVDSRSRHGLKASDAVKHEKSLAHHHKVRMDVIARGGHHSYESPGEASTSQAQAEPERTLEPWEWGNAPQDEDDWAAPGASGWAAPAPHNDDSWQQNSWGQDNQATWGNAGATWGDPDVPTWDFQPTWASVQFSQRQDKVDHMRHLIPYWRDSVDAAERGETLRFEDFLAQFSPGGKYADDPWGGPSGWPTAGGWEGEPNWGKEAAKWIAQAASPPRSVSSGVSSRTVKTPQRSGSVAMGRDTTYKKRRRMQQKMRDSGIDVHSFVDQFSRFDHADSERTRRAHHFVDLPQDRKVEEIQKRIRELGHVH